MSKTIIFACPKDGDKIGFHMESNMENYGYKIVPIGFPIDQFKYKSFKDKITNFFRKTFLGDKGYKRRLRFNQYRKDLLNQLNNLTEKADYALIIGADNYPKEFLELVKQKSKKMYGYLWDGLEVYPLHKEVIPLFDVFYVFDPNDLKYKTMFPNIKPATNFYFENLSNPHLKKEIDLYYLGGKTQERENQLRKIVEQTPHLSKNLVLVSNEEQQNTEKGLIKYTPKPLSYTENLEKVQKSKAVLDLLTDHHQGLSFRTFEAMSNNCKVITTNKTIKGYDFYNEDTIFVWDETNSAEISDFIKKSIHWESQKIKKYSFRNWLNYILENEEGEKISLPKQ